MNKATQQKREELATYIQTEVLQEPSIQGIVVYGSVAKGLARPNSDIDAVVFLDPYDLYAVPAEAKWLPETKDYVDIFQGPAQCIQIDFQRLDFDEWSRPSFNWPEAMRAELCHGWVAYDPDGKIEKLIAEKTAYSDKERMKRLDEAFVRLEALLDENKVERTWETLGDVTAHFRLHTAFNYLIQSLFAYNRRWRTYPSREMSALKELPWLPKAFDGNELKLTNALSKNKTAYLLRAKLLQNCFGEVIAACQQDGLFGKDPLSETFIRTHDEPGRAWNMEEWNRRHERR